MKNDISFIPEELLPEMLKKAAGEKIEYPYLTGNSQQIEEIKSGNFEKLDSEFLKIRNKYKQNFWSLEEQLIEFAKGNFDKKEYDLAERCFRYLINIGSKSAMVKEYLMRIYLKEQDSKGLNWIKMKINNQLGEAEDYHNQHKKLKKIKEKYQIK